MIPRARAALTAALVAVTALAAALPAAAAPPLSAAGRPLVADTLGHLSADLAGVVVHDAAYQVAFDAWDDAVDRRDDAERERVRAEGRLAELAAAHDRLASEVDDRRRQRRRATAVAAAARSQVVDMAVAAFVGDESAAWLGTVLEGLPDDEQLRRNVLGAAAHDASTERLRDAEVAQQRAVAAEREVAARLATIEAEQRTVDTDRADAAARASRWAAAAERHRRAAVDAAPLAEVAATDLRAVVLDAYWRGAATGGQACGLPWTVVAGIGRVESRHGTHRGAQPDARGDVHPRIIGIPLDGSNNTMAISDTDGGRLDGDVVVDRAVGPMQFIPSTWARHGVDGNDDGAVDPHSLYDAAASAARYLCRVARAPVASDEVLRRAVLGYNRSEAYVTAVLGHAVVYGQLVLPVPAR